MQVLWALQNNCDFISFSKVDDKHVVKAMFMAEPGALDL